MTAILARSATVFHIMCAVAALGILIVGWLTVPGSWVMPQSAAAIMVFSFWAGLDLYGHSFAETLSRYFMSDPLKTFISFVWADICAVTTFYLLIDKPGNGWDSLFGWMLFAFIPIGILFGVSRMIRWVLRGV